MAANDPLANADVLVLAFRHELALEEKKPRVDPVWQALIQAFAATDKVHEYARGGARYLTSLRAHKLYQENRDRFFLLHPQTSGELGRFTTCRAGTQNVLLFQSWLRLNTDGPDMPVFELMKQVIGEVKPRLVLAVGLGGGVLEEHQAGDVVVSDKARLQLHAELATSERDGEVSPGLWNPTDAMFADLPAFRALQEPQLVAPSPNYQSATAFQPAPHVPTVRISPLPVLTAPRVTEHGFEVLRPLKAGGAVPGAATEMDCAPVALACGTTTKFGAVIGLAVPAINVFRREDPKRVLRDGWIDFFTRKFAVDAAGNAASVAFRAASQA